MSPFTPTSFHRHEWFLPFAPIDFERSEKEWRGANGKWMFMNIKKHFPIFKNKNLIYLDNAATTQKPESVINSISDYYSNYNSNVKRGLYDIAEKSSELYEAARLKIADFINADITETIFTSGTTESINFIASSWGAKNIKPGDEIIVTELEHHSNFLPWQRLAEQKNAVLKIIPVNNDGSLNYTAFADLVTNKTKLIAITYQSNVTGEKIDLEFVKEWTKKSGAKLFVDAAQAVAHQKIDTKKLEADFIAFSAHKMFGPTGIGLLYIKKSVQHEVEPYQVGGGMVFEVFKDKALWLDAPYKFEAGTPKIAEAIAFGAAVDFINGSIDFKTVQEYEASLTNYLLEELKKIDFIKIIGSEEKIKNGHIVTFIHEKIHAHDIAYYLNKFGICVRAGNHCVQLLHKKLGINSSVRVSFSVYNTIDEVKVLITALQELNNSLNL